MDRKAKTCTIKYDSIVDKITSEVIIIDGRNKIMAEALWDTGATISCIGSHIAEQMGFTPSGKMKISGVAGTHDLNTYTLNLLLPNNLHIIGITLVECTGVDCILGMDIFSVGDLCISNFQGKTTATFVYPSQRETDYEQEREKAFLESDY